MRENFVLEPNQTVKMASRHPFGLLWPVLASIYREAHYYVSFIDKSSRYYPWRTRIKLFKFLKFLKIKQRISIEINKKSFKAVIGELSIATRSSRNIWKNVVFSEDYLHYELHNMMALPAKSRTIIKEARCLLIDPRLPQLFWAESVHAENELFIRSPSRSFNGDTPFQRWVGSVKIHQSAILMNTEEKCIVYVPTTRSFLLQGQVEWSVWNGQLHNPTLFENSYIPSIKLSFGQYHGLS